jgi:paraquat-inducible protein A
MNSPPPIPSSDHLRLQTCRALVIAGIILYVPANVIPVMTMTVVGRVEPLTVLGGVEELYHSGLPVIAGIVFLASIVVPFCKLATLSWLLIMHGSTECQQQRATARRIVHLIGSWSMVDIFLLSVLAAVGQLGVLASVVAKPGAFFFAAVLVCTIFASESYKPRMIWQTREPLET